LMQVEEMAQLGEELLREATQNVEDDEALFEAARDAEAEATRLERKADAELAAAGVPETQLDADDLTSKAEHEVEEAERKLAGINRRVPARGQLQGKAAGLRERISRLPRD
jgi:hypothetical protein